MPEKVTFSVADRLVNAPLFGATSPIAGGEPNELEEHGREEVIQEGGDLSPELEEYLRAFAAGRGRAGGEQEGDEEVGGAAGGADGIDEGEATDVPFTRTAALRVWNPSSTHSERTLDRVRFKPKT